MRDSRKPLLHHLQDYFFPHPRNNHRPHLFSVTSIAVLALAIVIFEAGYLVQTKIVFRTTDFLASVLPAVLTDLTNESRAAHGVTPVARSASLDAAAEAAAADMAARGYFAHQSPDGKTPWYWLAQVGYTHSYAGQNLAINFTDSHNVETAWMESPTHRANVLKQEYTEVGFGTASGVYEGKETTFVVEFFATPALAAADEARAPLALAEPRATPQPVVTTAPTPTVLGTETSAPAPVAQEASWFVVLLASPLTTLVTLCTILFGVIASFWGIAVLMRGRVQHPTVLVGGGFLLLFICATIVFTTHLSGPVLL